MSYKRRRVTGGRRTSDRTRRAVATASRTVVAQAKRLMAARRSYTGQELKFIDLDHDDTVIATGGTILNGSINLIAQGITESTRIGRKCTIRKIGWHMTWALPAVNATGGAPNADTGRAILYLDKQCNGATANVTDILETADWQSFNNLANKGRFRTLMDRSITLNYAAGSGSGGAADNDYAQNIVHEEFYKDVNIPIEYNDVNGVLSEIRSNNLGILLISNNGIIGFFSKIRLRFTDS